MSNGKAADYYRSMLNALRGLQDDLDANDAPQQAKDLLSECIQVCESDFRVTFAKE